MHPLAESLANEMIRTFWSADGQIQWEAIEEERLLWLEPNTALVGRMDARGLTEDGKMFGEWKTLSAYQGKKIDEVKASWRLNPQALTYGVLAPSDTRRFTVRWAIKDKTPRCDFEWYLYTDAEVAWWRGELIRIANDIRARRYKKIIPIHNGNGFIEVKDLVNWQTNLTTCMRYGWNYRCPYWDEGCSKLNFGGRIGEARVPHLDIEKAILTATEIPDLVVLDATRVGTWLECEEKYRRGYEGEGTAIDSEALTIGKDFHDIYGNHLKLIMERQNGTVG